MPGTRQHYTSLMTCLPTAAAGATLIEILVALLVVAIGLLGVAGLQTVGLRQLQSASLRTQAGILGGDMLERVLANRQGAVLGAYDGRVADLNPGCESLAGCDASELAGHDTAEWQAALQRFLPAGSGIVCIDSTPHDGTPEATGCDGAALGSATFHAVKIWWDEDRDGVAEKRITLSLRL
ncbi:MAG: type IV pilus modification protein PilV [Gammaproteobacteria bacterium]|nr:type IV pilus modification protein PilV [Gammaproteobacteria bacterium]